MSAIREARRFRGYRFDYRELVTPKGGLAGAGSNKTKLVGAVGKIELTCDMCGMEYETYAAWAKRYSRHYCSVACKAEGMITQEEKWCEICGWKYLVQKAHAPMSRCCSPECTKALRDRYQKHDHGRFYWISRSKS